MQRTWWWYEWSHSWTVVDNFRSMLVARGWGEFWGYQSYGPYNNGWNGDAILYDWDNNGSWDHVSMESVHYGTDPNSGWTGNLVNAHNSNRRNAIWHLRPYNANWQTTVYGVYHINY
jgi:hypothetical protein